MMITLWPDDDIDDRRAADDLLALGLRDAARDGDPHLAAVARGLVLGDAQPSELGVDLLGRLLADMAGVEDHQFRILGAGRLEKPLPASVSTMRCAS